MGIGFQFTASNSNRSKIDGILDSLKEEFEYRLYQEENYDMLDFCRLGQLYLSFENDIMTGNCRTNLAGAGFHAFAIDFVDTLAKAAKIQIQMEDDTNYYHQRDFKKMRQDHFYTYLKKMLAYAENLQNNSVDSLYLNWAMDTYKPKNIVGSVITPMGNFSAKTLFQWIQTEGIEPFAKEFYIWNEIEKDARYFRNSALNLMWEQCWFMPGTRSKRDDEVNQYIIDLLEVAAGMDRTLPFPKKEYQEICELNQNEMIDLTDIPAFELFPSIGYRRGMITYKLGNLTIPIPGSYLEEYDEVQHAMIFYDGLEQKWHNVRLSAFGCQNKPSFNNKLFEGEDIIEKFEFSVQDGMCKAAFMKEQVNENDKNDIYYQIIAEVISGMQITLITISFSDRKEEEWLLSLLKNMKAVIENEE